ncbi:Histone-lysine N-methyltransferase set9 [Ptychographa xylographoides]|nr:Histone-lysine N-methyltransferase set9 [Ptychographa xylographoides]
MNNRPWLRELERAFLSIWSPRCEFEICTTNRFELTTQEACVLAVRDIQADQIIEGLIGFIVPLAIEDETSLMRAGAAFSITSSDRKDAATLLLGPIRFANHSCDPNAQLTPDDNGYTTRLKALRKIWTGDEICISYGHDYFDVGARCLCESCENHQSRGWDHLPPGLPEVDQIAGAVTRHMRRQAAPKPLLWIQAAGPTIRDPYDHRTYRDYLDVSKAIPGTVGPITNCPCGRFRFVGTARQCPRCLRHTRLYGIAWPRRERDTAEPAPCAGPETTLPAAIDIGAACAGSLAIDADALDTESPPRKRRKVGR